MGGNEIRVGPEDWDRAIADSEGPQLVVAGPGTGKTEFLVRRARHLVESGKARPAETLILTFSRRAAADLGRRAVSTESWAGPVTATFHSFAHRLLEARGARSSQPVPTLLTGPEQVALVSDLLASEDPTGWPLQYRSLLSSRTLAAEVADFLLRARERLLEPADVAELAQKRPQWQALAAFMARYNHQLQERRRIDYGALIAEAISTLAAPGVAAEVAAQCRYVLVDEYQDTSPAQARLLELLVAQHRNITAAGDPYQSVYSFRGADLTNVVDFTDRFRHHDGSPARRLILTTSFRVPAAILEGALRVTAGGELPGGAGPVEPAPHAGRVEAYLFDQASAEAEWIAAQVERAHLEERLELRRMAVLVRSTRHLLPELSRALERRGIRHDTPDRRLVDHAAVRLIFDLTIVAGLDPASGIHESPTPDEADRAMRRLLLGPMFRLSLSHQRRLLRSRRRSNRQWAEIAGELENDGGLANLLSDPTWAVALPAADGFWTVWTALDGFRELVADPQFEEFRAALASFSQVLDQQYRRDPTVTLYEFYRRAMIEDFEASPLISYQRPGVDQLVLTTLHQAKGLEFDIVFVADATEGVFPDLRRSTALLHPEYLAASRSNGDIGFRIQEEMRLAYTAMTRASRRVVWTATTAAIDEGERRPSRFLLAASGRGSFTDLGPPPSNVTVPVTAPEVQALLRRVVTDPSASQPRRLAALTVLCHPPDGRWQPVELAGIAAKGPDTGVMRAGFRLSPSQAEAYEACPRRYVFERRLLAADDFSPYAHFGSLIHRVLEDSEAEARGEGQAHATLEAAKAVLDQVWMEDADFGSPVLNEAWRRRGRKLLENMHQDWPGGDASVVEVERRIQMEVDGITWSGKVDRFERHLPGELRVVDYKTSASEPTKDEAARSLQLGFYVLAARHDHEVSSWGWVSAAELWYPLARRTVSQFDMDQVADVERRMVVVGRRITAERWDATPGPHCDRCPVRLCCPAWPEGREAFVS
ncbi:MAG: ATP-dependent helicase [Actinomycetota bacterium]